MHEGKEKRGVIFDLQRYSIHDGPGIRTTVFFKGCPLRCFWCQNPESQRNQPEILLSQDNCASCGRCVTVCPTCASTLAEISSTIDRSRCVGCGKCVEVCPNKARTLVGRCVTVDEIMQEVMRDKKFYENSGGGVTLSGGEPMAQREFALSILQSCKKAGLHTVLDTCGYTPWASMREILKYIDLVLYDVKCMDRKKHHEATGKSNDVILANAKRVAKHKNMRVRIPIIPDFNDSVEEVKAILRFIRTELGLIDIDLLPYNKLGESKHKRLGRTAVVLQEKGEEQIRELEDIVRTYR